MDQTKFKPTAFDIEIALNVVEWARQDAMNELNPPLLKAGLDGDAEASDDIEFEMNLTNTMAGRCKIVIERAAERQGVTS